MSVKPPSPLEEEMAATIRYAGLPEPARQRPFRMPPLGPGRPARTAHFDFCWEGHGPEGSLGIVLEMEGGVWSNGGHNRPGVYTSNCEKYSRAAIAGWCVVRATREMVDDGRALSLLTEAFERGKA